MNLNRGPHDRRTLRVHLAFAFVVLTGALLLFGCNSGPAGRSPSATNVPGAIAQSSAVEPETNPPGDIPDNQAFVSFHSSAGGYVLQVPEGWARTESGPNVGYVDKLNSIAVQVTTNADAPTIDTVTATEVPQLQQQTEAFEQVEISTIDLSGGRAIHLRYRSNSAPDSVTGKKTRLETDRFEFFKDGKIGALSLSAPAGSDNVDVWRLISNSFAWD